jgi:hypothetical protein
MVLSLAALVPRRVLALLVRRDEDAKDLEIVLLRHQLQVLRRQVGRPRFRWSDRLFLAAASRRLRRGVWRIFLVHRIWRAFALQPHRTETFKLSADPLFIEKVRDLVGLYLRPPDRALVLCVDKKSQIQALDRTQPLLPMRSGQVERRTHDYAPRHHLAVRRARHEDGDGHWAAASATSQRRVPEVPRYDRRRGAG